MYSIACTVQRSANPFFNRFAVTGSLSQQAKIRLYLTKREHISKAFFCQVFLPEEGSNTEAVFLKVTLSSGGEVLERM